MALLDGSIQGAVSTRARQVGLWRGVDFGRLMTDPEYGYIFHDDFVPYVSSPYTVTQAVSGTFTQTAGKYGLATADSGATTNTQGVNIQTPAVFAAETNGMLFFEAYFKLSGNSTGPEFFIGLCETDTTVIGSGAITADETMGFYSIASNAITTRTEKNGTAAQSTSITPTLPTDGSYIKVGLRALGTREVEFWVNDQKMPTVHTSSISTANLALTLVCQSNGTTQPTVVLDWWTAACVYQADR